MNARQPTSPILDLNQGENRTAAAEFQPVEESLCAYSSHNISFNTNALQ